MKSLTIIGNFKEFYGPQYDGILDMDHVYGGIRNHSIINGLATELQKYFDVICHDITDMDDFQFNAKGQHITPGISNIIKHYYTGQFFLYVNNGRNYNIDIPINTIYFHVDGAINISPNQAVFGFRLLNGDRYQVHDYHLNILPFVTMSAYNPNRKKDIFISKISREIPYEEYVDLLERSYYTLIACDWVAKRTFEALACKTIPIILTTKEQLPYYQLGGFTEEFCYLKRWDDWETFDSILLKEYDSEMAENGYQFIKKYHSAEKRVKRIARFIRKILNGKYPYLNEVGNRIYPKKITYIEGEKWYIDHGV